MKRRWFRVSEARQAQDALQWVFYCLVLFVFSVGVLAAGEFWLGLILMVLSSLAAALASWFLPGDFRSAAAWRRAIRLAFGRADNERNTDQTGGQDFGM